MFVIIVSTMYRMTFVFLSLVTVELSVLSLTFRAAVVEFPFLPNPGASPREIMLCNAKRYEEYIVKAASKKTQIIVFPEYGLTTWAALNSTRDTIQPYLQVIPDIKLWNPCTDVQASEKNNEILVLLGCMARNNNIIIVANLLTKEKCHKRKHTKCPSNTNESFHFNTNVVFSHNGILLATYHKFHLFEEEKFLDAPSHPEFPLINVGFTHITTFTCFDIDFYKPAAELVLKNNIKTVIFTTSWNNELPFSLAPQVYSSWARGLGINFLAANYHYPKSGGFGSGIYSSQLGKLNQFYDLSSIEYLIIADLPFHPLPVPINKLEKFTSCNSSPFKILSNYSTIPFTMTDTPSSKPTGKIHKIHYQNLNNFSITHLQELETESSVNSGSVCCHVSYQITRTNFIKGYYALLAFGGFRQYRDYKWPIEVCTVLWCEVENGIETCGRVWKGKINVRFEYLSLSGIFSTKAVFPSVINSNLENINTKLWNYTANVDAKLKMKSAFIEFKSLDSVLGVNLLAIV